MTSEDNSFRIGYCRRRDNRLWYHIWDASARPVGLLASAAGESLDAFVLVDDAGSNRYPPIAGTDQPGMGQQPHLAQKRSRWSWKKRLD